MALSEEALRTYTRRLLLSRMRLLCTHGFYALLLLHMKYSVDEAVDTACTDGIRITFGTRFLEGLSDDELDFVMMHEILHVALQHCLRTGDRDRTLFNIACDIVVNSNILLENKMDVKKITLREYGEAMHLTPNGDEGHKYTAEQVYAMLVKEQQKAPRSGGGNGKRNENSKNGGSQGQSQDNTDNRQGRSQSGAAASQSRAQSSRNATVGNSAAKGADTAAPYATWDDHSRWGTVSEEEHLEEVWAKRLQDACTAIEIRDPANDRGLLPAFAKRLLDELRHPQTDWRTVLNEFVQEEVADYSFSPPDRRFDETPFFLPDFNGTVDVVKNILFMIDTSGSMSDRMITAAYSEVKGAIDQFDGKLCGWLGFFDAAVIKPRRFENEDEMRVIRPVGGGGTDFGVVFRYVREKMAEDPPVSIIILTDGYAPFPEERDAGGIPVLWLLNNEEVTPPWGRLTRIKL